MSGQFHCLQCGRKHNRNSDIGGFHHAELDVEKEGFEPKEAAVGISFVRAASERRKPTATLEEIEQSFQNLGFDEQFPITSVEEIITDWNNSGSIGEDRHSGKHWFIFLANKYEINAIGRSPKSLHIWMKKYSTALEKTRKR